MKIVVFGCQQIGVDVLNYLSNKKEIEIPLAVTYELPLDKTYGYESVMDFCTKKTIDCIQPGHITESVMRQVSDIEAQDY